MAKKQRKTLDDYIYQHLHFADSDEFIIFLVWAVFVSVFLVSVVK